MSYKCRDLQRRSLLQVSEFTKTNRGHTPNHFDFNSLNRSRLEHYLQACAIDSTTFKCAGRASSCRMAILGIIGTPLRMTCSCHNTDSLYECLGWHRLLWLNTCVGKLISPVSFHSRSDFRLI